MFTTAGKDNREQHDHRQPMSVHAPSCHAPCRPVQKSALEIELRPGTMAETPLGRRKQKNDGPGVRGRTEPVDENFDGSWCEGGGHQDPSGEAAATEALLASGCHCDLYKQ